MFHRLNIAGQTLLLLPEKAVFWEEEKILIVADIHLGKAAHFRKHGIPVPSKINERNLDRLDILIDEWDPDQLIFLGDLFHSDPNPETELFADWCYRRCNLKLVLTIGNHDKHHQSAHYEQIEVVEQKVIFPFLFRHMPEFVCSNSDLVEISGHIHPSIKISVGGRQRHRLPAYLKTGNTVLLPAFGEFTGTHNLKMPAKPESYVIVDDRVILI
jgi:DNA ligase-associated metallophosphoesterase